MANQNRSYWVILRPGEDVDCYIAHALDNDFIVPGRNPRDALVRLIETMQLQELTEREDGWDFEGRAKAPAEFWQARDALMGARRLVPTTDTALRTVARMRQAVVVVLEIPKATRKAKADKALVGKLLMQSRIAA